jgi:hypothetical protein
MLRRIVVALALLSFSGVFVSSVAAENSRKASDGTAAVSNNNVRTHVFQSDSPSEQLKSAVSQDLRSAKLDQASVRAASTEELDGMELTLQKYQTAFENLSLPQIRQVWPGLDRRRESAFKDVFAYLRSSSAAPKLGFECAPPSVIGDSARVQCRETLAYSDTKGKTKEVKPAMVSILLRKQSNNWIVETMKGAPSAK